MRRLTAGIFVMLLLAVGVAAAATISIPSGTDIVTDGNVTVTTTDARTVQSPYQPAADQDGDGVYETLQLPGGNVSGQDARVTVQGSLNGTQTMLTNISADSGTVAVNPDNRREVRVSGGTDSLSYSEILVSEGNEDVTYAGDSGRTQLTVTDVGANSILRVEETDGTRLDIAEANGNGVVTFDLPNSEHTVDIIETDNTAPDVTNLQPGNVTTTDVTLSADIDDGEFADNQNVTVEIYFDGTLESTQEISSAQTVTVDKNSVTGGTHNLTVVATDDFGDSSRAERTVGVPGTMTIREEDDLQPKVDSVSIRLRAFDDDGNVVDIIERNVTNGEVDLAGFPATSNVEITMEAEGYYDRTTVLSSIVGQQTVYLLNNSTTNYQTEISLSDLTGRFGSDSRLVVQRPINQSGTITYQRVAGDQIGADGSIDTRLQEGIRYRIRALSPTGDSRVLGYYTPTRAQEVTLRVSQLELLAGEQLDSPTFRTSQEVTGEGASKNKTLRYEFRDPANNTKRLSVTIHEAGNPSNVLTTVRSGSASDPLGNSTFVTTVEGENANKTWVANHSYTSLNDGAASGTVTFGANQYNLGLVETLDDGYASIFGVGFVILLGGIFSAGNARIGAVLIPGVTMIMWQIGILTGSTSLFAIGLAFAIGVGYNIIATTGGVRPT